MREKTDWGKSEYVCIVLNPMWYAFLRLSSDSLSLDGCVSWIP